MSEPHKYFPRAYQTLYFDRDGTVVNTGGSDSFQEAEAHARRCLLPDSITKPHEFAMILSSDMSSLACLRHRQPRGISWESFDTSKPSALIGAETSDRKDEFPPLPKSVRTSSQWRHYSCSDAAARGCGYEVPVTVTVRWDDSCGNGYNTFGIYIPGSSSEGALRFFPALAAMQKFHGFNVDGPPHYLKKTCHLASDLDYAGRRKGERSEVCYYIQTSDGGLLVTWPGVEDGSGVGRPPRLLVFDNRHAAEMYVHQRPLLHNTTVAEVVTGKSEGKERQLNAARDSACWPEATDEELTAPGLEDRLKARFPKLMREFYEAVTGLGFTW